MSDDGNSAGEACRRVEDLWTDHLVFRSLFQYLRAKDEGKTSVSAGKGRDNPYLHLAFREPISPSSRERHNELAHYLNGSFVVRLVATLEQYVRNPGKADEILPGYQHYKVARWLRNRLAHRMRGAYDEHDAHCVETKVAMERLYGPGQALEDDKLRFNLSISEVLSPMKDGCLKFVEAFLAKGK